MTERKARATGTGLKPTFAGVGFRGLKPPANPAEQAKAITAAGGPLHRPLGPFFGDGFGLGEEG